MGMNYLVDSGLVGYDGDVFFSGYHVEKAFG